jgi:hypothetical protein
MFFIGMMLIVAFGFYLWNVAAMIGYHAPAKQIAVKVRLPRPCKADSC